MRISCLHGYFIFEETKVGEISRFMKRFGFDLVRKDHFYTFEFLSSAQNYSILANSYLGVPAIKTFAGEPWQVMRENRIVYDFNLGLAAPILSITNRANLSTGQNYYLANGLLQPGSLNSQGQRVTDYDGHFSFDTMQFKYTEVTFA